MPRKTKLLQKLDEDISIIKDILEYSLKRLMLVREQVEKFENERLAHKRKPPSNKQQKETKKELPDGIIKFNDNEEPLIVEF